MKEGTAKSNLIYENIYCSSAPLLIQAFFLNKENNEGGFTIKGMMVHARTGEWIKVKSNDTSLIPSLI